VIHDSRTLMRPSCRIPLTIRVAAFTILIVFFSGVAPRLSRGQAASTLPKSWNDAVAKLGDEVAAAMSPTSVAVSVENISSLDASYVAAIGAALREQLQHHSFTLPAVNSTTAQSAVSLQLTLSESADEYFWVIQIPEDATEGKPSPTMIVSVPKSDPTEAGPEQQSLSLEKRFVWQQPDRFLDFALLKSSASGEPTLLLLEPKRLAVYKASGDGWQFSRSSVIPQASTPSRNPEGTIDLKAGKISLKDLECVGDPDLAGVVGCKPFKPARRLGGPIVEIPGLPNSVGAGVAEKCHDEYVSLFTAEGDWTRSDSVRAYLAKGVPLPVHPAGNTLDFDGPVMALHSDFEGSSTRAIVHNLKTGKYEAYNVTAICGN
jgi:hypothetical protein